MTKIDFYVLEAMNRPQSLHFACQLIEKFYHQQKLIYVCVDSKQEAERLDTLLWTYRDISFLPHTLLTSADSEPTAIQIGFTEAACQHPDVLVNLSSEVPTGYQRFQHTIEIVAAEPLLQQAARERYRHYSKQQCELTTHKIKMN